MTGKLIRYVLGLSLVAIPLIAVGQQGSSGMDQSGASSMAGQEVTATGCLQKGQEKGGYFLKGDDGKDWELSGSGLAAHVGHKVTVTGQQMQRSDDQETKVATSEKAEAAGGQYGDLRVSQVKMVSTSCQ
jgi:hypothetical protein